MSDDGIDQLQKDLEASGGLCLDCRVNPRYKGALECKACLDKKTPPRAGLTVAECRCNCGYTCDRAKCPLPMDECIDQHWKQDCDHQWDGPWQDFEMPGGGGGGSVTCSKCGMASINHDCAVGP